MEIVDRNGLLEPQVPHPHSAVSTSAETGKSLATHAHLSHDVLVPPERKFCRIPALSRVSQVVQLYVLIVQSSDQKTAAAVCG